VHRVTASLSKLQQELASSNKMLSNQIAVMNRSFSDTLRSTGQYSTHFVSLQSDVEKFGRNLDSGKLKLNQYFHTFRDQAKTSGGLIRDLAKQQVSLQNSVLQPLGRNAQGLMQFNVHVPRGLDEVKNKTAIARQELQIMNKVIQDGAGQLINWGKNTQWAGRQLTVGLTVPLVAFGTAASKAFREADQELVRLTKVYGDVAGTSAAELGRVRDEVSNTAKEISAAMGVSFKETIALAADIAATGKMGDELLGSLQETTRLAVLGEVDRQDAMKATLAIQSAFKQNTDELANSINFLNAVENQTSTTLNDLVEAIPKAGPVVKALGGDIQDLALYLTAMREGGVNAAEGANAIKSSLASLINPSKVAKDMFNGFGINLEKIVQGNAGNITATIMELQGALDQLDPLNKTQAIEQLFGKFQFSRLSALFENLGKEGSQTLQVLDLMKASTSELATVADRELAAVTESASGKYRRSIESLRASLAEVGEQFLQINTVLIQVIDKVIQFANNLPGPVKQVLALAGGFTAVIGPVIMLTGVLANFFGYMLKGIFHMKAFFKGGEGWKYLTPEMLAAEKAGKLVEQSFYSDAKAAAVLKQALGNLIDEFSILEAKAKAGAMSVNPAVSTMAGNLVMAAGGSRVVNPNHPLAGTQGTRASSHMVPRSGMTEAQRMQQTMFGMVPGSIAVNQKIGQNPQIYMDEALPNVPGLTTIKGVSTGIVSGEAARWHAMMATLGMQSKAEIENLKKTIATTGTVSKQFMMQFDDILPAVSVLTKNAAVESSLIVAELRAGKINLDAARAKIVALNLETERLIADTVRAQATAMGRTINPTMVPTLNQPVVDPTGKSNMRELFKKGKTRDFINRIAGTLGVRTSGAGYNIETTVPRKMNAGGYVYTMNDGNIVPGPNVNRDVVPAMLTPGEFVVNKEATSANLPLLRSINSQSGSSLPIGYMPPEVSDSVLGAFGQRSRSRGSSSPATLVGRWGMIMPETINGALAQKLNSPGAKGSDLLALLQQPDRLIDLEDFLSYNGVDPKDIDMVKRKVAADMARQIQPNAYYADGGFGKIAMNSTQSVVSGLESKYPGINLRFQKDRMTPGRRDTLRRPRAGETQAQANTRGGGSPTGINYNNQRPSNYRSGASRGAAFGSNQVWGHFADQEMQKNTSMLSRAFGFARRTPNLMALRNPGPSRAMSFIPGLFRRNSGGMIPGYNMGGVVMPQSIPVPAQNGRYNMGGMVQGYNEGGEVGGFRQGFETSRNKNSGASSGRGMSAMGSTGMFMGGMGLSMAGSAVGGTAGGIMSSAGMAMQFLPMLSGLKGVMGSLTKLTALTKTFGSIAGTAFRLAATAIKFMTGPVGLLVLGMTAVTAIIKKMRKDHADAVREEVAMFGMSKKGAEELGITYTSITDKIKAVREEQKLAADKAKAYFESYSMAGGALTLTIKQLKELKKRVKEDMPETLEILNNIDSSKINDWAANLKSQMISSGKSVEESTNLIYALIEASDKAGQGVGAISSQLFSGIVDQGSAADFVLKNLVKNIESISQIDASAFAANVDSTISSLDAAVKSLVGTKDASGETIDEAEAIAMQFERMANAKIKDRQLGKETLSVLKSQRPELANILNQSDTIGGMYAKWRIFLQGVKVDLEKISSAQAETLAAFTAGLDAASAQAIAADSTVAGLEEARVALKELKKSYADAQKRSNTDKIDSAGLSKQKIKAIQDEIKAIRERAEARKKALRETFNKENAELELQKAKLDLQNAVARGDNEAAAAAQIRIQQIQKESSLRAAETKIDENAKKAEAKQQSILDKDAAYKDALREGAAKQGSRAENLQGSISTISALAATLGRVASLQIFAEGSTATTQQKTDFKQAFANALNDIAKAAKSDPKVLESYGQFLERRETGKDKKGNPIFEYQKDKDGNFMPGKMNQAYKSMLPGFSTSEGSALTELKQLSQGMSDFATKITGGTTLKQIYDILAKGANKPGDKMDTLKTQVVGAGSRTPVTVTTVSAAELTERGISFTKGTVFKSGKDSYEVTSDSPDRSGAVKVKRKAMGGYITRAASGITGMTSSQPYLVGERGPELFVPSSGGQIIPNNLLGPNYNIPNGSISGVSSMSNASSNNIVYNIDIDLNGTNVTADDIMRKFKSELALIGAKEGRVRTLGGNY
jgi:TP901 family phage tail tape measure protein